MSWKDSISSKSRENQIPSGKILPAHEFYVSGKALRKMLSAQFIHKKASYCFLMPLWIMCNLHRSYSTCHPINSLQLHHPLHHYNRMAMPVNAMYSDLFDNILPLYLPSSPSNEGPSGGMLPIDERLSSFLHCILWELLSYRPTCMWP